MHKQIINDPSRCVDEFLSGFVKSNKGLIQLPGHRVILRKDLENVKGKVALLSGGGAGHEPAHVGYVGRGMLSGAISGAIFTSPPPSSIFAAIKAINRYGPKGVIIIFKNYTGDRINFGLAREWALNEGIKVELVIVGEDCALTSPDQSAGRRGLAGAVLVHKIGGALAEQGDSLQSIHRILLDVTKNMGTIGVCLRPCVCPGEKSTSFELGENEVELGLGIHGEAGVRRISLGSSSEIVKSMIDHMTDKDSASRLSLSDQDEVVLLINNLGSTSALEMGVITNDVTEILSSIGLKIKKVYCGTYVTSLQMLGFSITVLRLNLHLGVPLMPLLEMEAEVASPLTTVSFDPTKPDPDLRVFETPDILSSIKKEPNITQLMSFSFKNCIISSCKSLLSIKDKLNDFDRGSGDGDCGSTHARGAEAVLAAVEDIKDFSCPAKILQKIGLVCSEKMGGSSGAMYSIFMASAARRLSESDTFNLNSLSKSIYEGVGSIEQYGGAKVGDRTMLDVLRPVSDKLCSSKETLHHLCLEIIELAKTSAQATTKMKARAGRASYVRQDQLVNPDPGAVAVAEIIIACAATCAITCPIT